ncbi:hypothetical protein CVT25_002330 [Psilocybe cyanescens]|uniref:FAD-binding domain-containing protein n=1 Tax=Psilocybe cyanescens TaxID=93625 RepID=A0A409WKN0_PSICY|nr:hypothetical protein CVT25_002330 [Psilocybe cyanescens]
MPSNNSQRQNKATICLKVVVIGGGLAGLIAAYALSCAGHDVTIVERREKTPQSFGVSQSPPNMTRILNRWGLKPLLDREAEKCASLVMRNGRNGDLIGAMHFDKDFLHDLVADFLFLRTEKLGDLFQQLADDEGVNSVSATVSGIQTSQTNVTVTLDNGQTISSDFLVCADGYDSSFRRLVSGVDEEEDRRSAKAHLAITFILPMDLVTQDEELKSIMNPAHWLVWFGSGFIFHTSAPDGGKNLSGTMLSNYNREVLPEEELWANRPLEYWGIDLNGFEPRAQKLLSLAKAVSSRVFVQRSSLEDLVCDNSRIVLVGDAAHPILPGNNQHIGLSVEDAEALRCIFSRIHDRDQIAEFLSAYEDIRQPRTTHVVEYDLSMNTMLMMPDGPEQDGRNALLSQSMAHGDWDHMDEAEFKAVWGQELDVYTHDATDQVDDWWTKWGSMMSKKPQHSDHDAAPTTSIPGLHRVFQECIFNLYKNHPTTAKAYLPVLRLRLDTITEILFVMSTSKPEHKTKAPISLKIIVVGAGIGGLSAAYALRCAGHDVTIVDKREGKPRIKSQGISHSPPNMTKILCKWGMEELMEGEAQTYNSLVMRKGQLGDLIGIMHFDKDFLHDLCANYMVVRVQKLVDMLQALIREDGVNVLSATVTTMHSSPDNATITLDDGQTLSADFLVCADGYDSTFRSIVTGVEDDDDLDTPPKAHLITTFILPMDVIRQEKVLQYNTDPAQWQVWQVWNGPGFIFHLNAPEGDKYLSITMSSDYNGEIRPGDEVWSNRPLEYWGIDVEDYEPRIKALLSLTKYVTSRVLISRPALDDLVCENSKIALVGDAAHPILPASNHHLGISFEDAETLRCLFSRIRHRDQISNFLAAYEEIRQPRVAHLVEFDRNFHLTMKVENGPQRDELHAMLSQGMAHGDWDHMDEGSFRAVWGEELNTYTYDASDQVEDWFTKWGAMMSKNMEETKDAPKISSIPGLHRVSISQSDHP